MIKILRNSRKNKLIAAIVAIVLLLSLALSIHIFAADETEYIYFDLAAGDVTINATNYSGYVYVNINGTPQPVQVTGAHSKNNNYYVYQSSSSNRATTGYYEGSLDGKFRLPEYDRVVASNGTKWNEYITDHPRKWGAVSDISSTKNGSNSVIAVIDEWESAVAGKRELSDNFIEISGNVETVNLVIDDVWSNYLKEHRSTGRKGSISFDASSSSIKNNTINLYMEGDNRLAALFYATGSGDPKDITKESRPNKGNTFNFSVLKDKTATLTVAADAHNLTGNFWSAAIGSSDGSSPCEGLVFNDGYIYAGTTEYEDATAIGGGGNGYANITINGGTITAVASTSGSAIGGGIGKSDPGGQADITIQGGSVYAYNWSFGTLANVRGAADLMAPDGQARDTNENQPNGVNLSAYAYIPAAAIGGGSSCNSAGCAFSVIEIKGGYVYAQSVAGTAIGGGSSTKNDGGSTDVIISGGTVEAKSIEGKLYSSGVLTSVDAGVAIGGGTGNQDSKHGGSAQLTVSGDAKLYTGSIGGGKGHNIGSANVTISGGTIQGQVVMEGEGSTFDMTGGTIDNANAADAGYVFVEDNGGAVCVKTGTATISGGTIKNCNNTGNNGGAIYLTNGTVTVSGGTITDCKATSGGAIYVGGGSATVRGGIITKCIAENGGAAYVTGGTFTMTNGDITDSSATQNGGAIYVSGDAVIQGNVTISGGSLTNNKAAQNGGAVYVNNGDVLMQGGILTGNKALDGDGGAFYVSSTLDIVNVTMTSGEISANDSTGRGGAIAVSGAETSKIVVTIGKNAAHPGCDHNGDAVNDELCPIVKNNTSDGEGGAIYISGGDETLLDIYCIEEEGNRGGGYDAGSKDTTRSDFLKVEGGKVIISSAKENDPETDDNNYGNSEIYSSVHITGGDMFLYGTMESPLFHNRITVDIEQGQGSYVDNRKNTNNSKTYYKIEYFENFEENGVYSGQYTAIQVAQDQTHTILGVIYEHPGLTIDGWNTQKDGEGSEYPVSKVLDFDGDNTDFLKDFKDNKLVLYAVWTKQAYIIAFDPSAPAGVTVQGKMESVTVSFTEAYVLKENLYVYAGKLFDYWQYQKDDGTYAQLADGEEITTPLTSKHGKTVTLYAVWKTCAHTDSSKYTLTRDSDDTLRCTCICQYYITATIVGEDTVYDGGEHRADITYYESNPESFKKEILLQNNLTLNILSNIVYSKDNGAFSSAAPVNAGTYKAKIGTGDLEIFTVYVIKKAPQAAPLNKPTFTVEGDNSSEYKKLIINEAPEEDKFGKEGTSIKYAISYYEDTTLKTVILSGNEYDQFKTAWTTYYVYAYYPESTNYEESPHTRSAQAYIYEGKINIYINNPAGVISHITARKDGKAGIMITSVVEDGKPYYIATYYDYSCTVSDALKGKVKLNRVTGEFAFTMDSFNDNSISGDITFTIIGSERIATVDGSISAGEKFGVLPEGDSIKIANDSAFTAGFAIEHYKNYSNLAVEFNYALPKDTTVILVDKSGTQPTFWYVNVSAPTSKIELTEFTKMGGVDKFVVLEGAEKLSYQIIVDFSDVDNASLLADDTPLKANLTADNNNGAPDLPEKTLSATLKAVTYSIEFDDNTDSAEVKLPESEGATSKWDDLNGVIVLQLDAGILPIDVSLSVDEKVDGVIHNTVYDLNEQNQFIVHLNKKASDVSFKLVSKMFSTNATYRFKVLTYASYVDKAPHGSISLSGPADTYISFSVSVPQKPSAILEGSQKLLKIGETLTLELKFKVDEKHTYNILLLRKDDKNQQIGGLYGTYIDTAYEYEGIKDLAKDGATNTLEIPMNDAYEKGSFCVVFEVRDEQNAEVLYVPYYFVLQD